MNKIIEDAINVRWHKDEDTQELGPNFICCTKYMPQILAISIVQILAII